MKKWVESEGNGELRKRKNRKGLALRLALLTVRVPKCRHIVAMLLAIVARRSHSIHLLRAASLSRYTHTHTHDTTCTQQNMESSSSSSERENYLHFNKSIFLLRFSLLFYFLFTFFSFNLHLVCLLLLCQHITTPFSFSFLDSIRRVE